MIEKLISGGRAGADYGALLAAYFLNIPTSGYTIKNRIVKEFKLKKINSSRYTDCLKANIDYADGVIVFRLFKSNITDKSIGYAIRKKWDYPPHNAVMETYKPIYVVSDFSDEEMEEVRNFIKKWKIKNPTVIGHGKNIRHLDMETSVCDFLITTLGPQELISSSDFDFDFDFDSDSDSDSYLAAYLISSFMSCFMLWVFAIYYT